MKRWLYYTRLGILDLVRLWPGTQQHAIIVAGICLPILLLLGLKRGHVAELRKDLLTSPSGRQVTFWSANKGALLTHPAMQRLEAELPAVDLVIPEAQRFVQLQALGDTGAAPSSISITLYATCPGDPVLAQVGGDVLHSKEHALVLPSAVADALGVARGSRVRLTVDRQRGGIEDSASVDLPVKAVIPSGPEKNRIGYADAAFLEALECFVRGHRVPELNWPALPAPVRDKYAGYLLFCERANDLTAEDKAALAERGLQAHMADASEFQPVRQLLKPKSVSEIQLYSLASPASSTDPSRRLSFAPSELAQLTAADDVVLPWNSPQEFSTQDGLVQLVGFSMPRRCWMREHLLTSDAAFDFDANADVARDCFGTVDASGKPATLTLPLGNGQELDLKLTQSSEPSSGGSSTGLVAAPAQAKSGVPVGAAAPGASQSNNQAVDQRATNPAKASGKPVGILTVPAQLLAQLDAFRAGSAQFDPSLRMFVPVPDQPAYDKARLYAATIDDVPKIVEELIKRHFAVLSESTRIAEIHTQDQSLYLLVTVVGLGVFFFGIVTVVSVLSDATDRKRGTIGILRVMGVSRAGVFYLVILRAAAIGVFAGGLSLLCGEAIAMLLAWPAPQESWLYAWKPTVSIFIQPSDLYLIFAGAMACSSIGALWPAWRASHLDPFDAIVEGRFR